MAPRAAFEIGQYKVPAGSRQTVDVPVSVLSDHTPVTMSVHVVHGKRSGPTVFVSGGVHGDEVIGVEIIRRLLKAPGIAAMRGTLLAIPIVNAFGFINHSRYLPDRRDLNRMFPGSASGPLASRLAHQFMSEIVLRSDLGIDLHSAAIHRINYPQVRVSPDNERTMELAKIFGSPIIMRSPIRDGSLRQAAADAGKDVLLFEAGEGLRFDELSVRAGVAGVLRIMRHFKMLTAKGISKPKSGPWVCRSSKWLRAPMGGLLRIFKADGELVREGTILGAVSDPFGEREQDIIAPFGGVIVGRAVMPVVNEGDAVFHLGRVMSVSRAEGTLENLSNQLEDDPMFDEDEII
jgi:predicted deacylase